MTKEEFARLSAGIKGFYPAFQVMPNEESMELWYQQLKDLEYKTASIAISKHVCTNKYPPSVAEIRKGYMDITNGYIPDWGEGWEQVLKAIRWYGYNRELEAMDSFDEITKQVVRRLGWINLCMSEEISVERANFRTLYESIAEKYRNEMQIPSAIRAVIEANQEKHEQLLTDKEADACENNVSENKSDETEMSENVQKMLQEFRNRMRCKP